MKVICMYLPQYHTFPENDEWWGKGYTEWTAVKRGTPLYQGHMQPRVPLDGRYYDLLNDAIATWQWQAELARQYGVYGFCIYQYWFRGRQLMEKPMEILLQHPEIDLHYTICWANESWTRTWYGIEEEILMQQEYGEEADWRRHFEYLLSFFRDSRYIQIDGKPVLHIYKTSDIECLEQMLACFRRWATEEGFAGLYIVSAKTAAEQETRAELIDGYYYFEPGYTLKHDFGLFHQFYYNTSVFIKTRLNKMKKKKMLERAIPSRWILDKIEARSYEAENEFPGLIPDWDNTPRRSYKGLAYTNTSPKQFEKVLRTIGQKIEHKKLNHVYINAWNEWGEGAMLEPDEYRRYGYLEAIRRVIDELEQS